MKRFSVPGFLLLFFPLLLTAQQAEVKNLVFEGAGIRGLAYAGALKSLEEQSIIEGVEKVGGTSAGATAALMISLGYNSEELFTILSEAKFHKFNEGRFIFFGGIHRLKKKFGWYRTERIEDWLGELIAQKTNNPDITFAQLAAQGYKDLYATATCLNQQKLLVFSKETYPDMKVKDAVLISMLVPFYFQAAFIDEQGKVYDKPAEGLDVVVDGGIIGNFPIHIFDEVYIDKDGVEQRTANPNTLGIRIEDPSQIEADQREKELVEMEIESFKDYGRAFYILVIESLNRAQLTPEDWARTVSISSEGVGPKIRRLSVEERMLLLDSGERFTRGYFVK